MKRRIMSVVLAGIIAAGAMTAVSAEDAPEYAKGISFKKDSGYHLNTYTGYVDGAELGVTAGEILDALENKNGVVIFGDSKRADGDVVQHGDTIGVTKEGNAVRDEFHIIFMGNADRNNKFNVGDASAVLKKIAKWSVDIDEVASDVNGDGQMNVGDASLILKKIAKWDVEFVKVPVLPGKGDTRVSAAINTSDANNPTVHPNINLRKGQDLGIKFTVAEGKVAKYAKAQFPSWGDSKGSIRLSLYKWDTDYETTVANDPIVTEFYENFADGTEIKFDFTDTAGKGVGEGEYLWRIHEGFDERINPDDTNEPVGVGLFTQGCPGADSGVTVYFEGEALDPTSDQSFGPNAIIGIGD